MNAFIVFAFVASITPGPTNVLILANSGRHGFVATLPLVLGAAGGAAALVWIAGTGLSTPLTNYPSIHLGLNIVGLAWLTWLALQLFNSTPPQLQPQVDESHSNRQGALAGAALQLVNPKTWLMAFATIGVFLPQLDAHGLSAVTRLAAVFAVIATACLALWAGLGCQSSRWLTSPGRMRRFNQCMALLLLAATWSAPWL